MPIVIARTGPMEVIDNGGLDAAAITEMWGVMLRRYVQHHPEVWDTPTSKEAGRTA